MEPFRMDVNKYKEMLQKYLYTKDENALYQAGQFSKQTMRHNILPEEIINIHIQSLKEIYPDLPPTIDDSLNFLLETMISYGLAYQEFISLREKQTELESEIAVAASMQQTLLSTKKPNVPGLDIGSISVPAHQMNGDYYHFVKDRHQNIGIAIADVIGKGVPAALAMSMIKYSLDSLPETMRNPSQVLQSLNRVVERNVTASMFITMFYGWYQYETCTLHYASAGHEPGYYYSAKDDRFYEMKTKGLVLGVSDEANYEQVKVQLEKNDTIILFTDGVTECRVGERFLEIEEVLEVIKAYMHLPAQEAVDKVFRHFERLQDFQLRDDFTLIILKKQVS